MNNPTLLYVFILMLLSSVLLAGALEYDYSYTMECLERPWKALYGGGIIENPEMNEGLKGWSSFGNAKLQLQQSSSNYFLRTHSRTLPFHSPSQTILLSSNMLYSFSAWIQVSEGSAVVTATFNTSNGKIEAAKIIAESNCWSMLKGGLTVNASGLAHLYFESNNTAAEIWIDSVSLQSFSKEEWASHRRSSNDKNRKSEVRIQATDKQGNPLPNATISIKQNRPAFPVGCAINDKIISNSAYQNWFVKRFSVTTFTNEMKWYATEGWVRGKENYSVPDAMLAFAKHNKISVRGHNVFWDDPHFQPRWVPQLSPSELSKAVGTRINSVMSRYKKQLIGWDVMNENLHFRFFEDRLGPNESAVLYDMAGKIDGETTLFMNEYNTIEEPRDLKSSPSNYLKKLKEIQSYSRGLKMGIGLESHFNTPNIPYMRASLDILGATNLPIWLTELDVPTGPNQAKYLEEILREGQAHPKVEGIVIWAPPISCIKMCLTDNNFKNLETGDVVDKLLHEWGVYNNLLQLTADSDGVLTTTLYHGHYEVKVNHPSPLNSSSLYTIKVSPKDINTINLQLTA